MTSVLHPSLILTFYHLFFKGCTETHSNAHGIIESIDYNIGQYRNNYQCTYIIEAKYGNKVLLEFDEFDLEYSTGCTKDYLKFEEGGGTTSTRCGNDKRPYFSKTEIIMLEFSSDGSNIGKGFRIRYKSMNTASYTIYYILYAIYINMYIHYIYIYIYIYNIYIYIYIYI